MFKVTNDKVKEAWSSIQSILEEAKDLTYYDADYAEAFGRAMTLYILGIEETSPNRVDSTFHKILNSEIDRREQKKENETSINLIEDK